MIRLLNCDIKWDDGQIMCGYLCAIGIYNEDNAEHRKIDYLIFHWFESEQDIKDHMVKGVADFIVLSYEFRN